jgi:outer membrane biosynthesis protein TonB
MQRFGSFALYIALAAGSAAGQQADSSSPSAQADAQSERVKVYSAGPGVTAPVLLPSNLLAIPKQKCKNRLDGSVELSLLVDSSGHPRNIMFLQAAGTDLDRLALRIAGMDKFSPGAVDGKPVVMSQTLEVDIQSCRVESKSSAGMRVKLIFYTIVLEVIDYQHVASLKIA